MNITTKLVLILIGMAYLISPVDLIPDLLLPWVGWIDDGLVVWCIYYLLRYGELPWFLFKRPGQPAPKPGASPKNRQSSGRTAKTGPAPKQKKKEKTKDRGNPKKDTASPWEILGVRHGAPWSEVQKAYKEKAKQYHPDKLSHLGEEFSSLANEKFLEIQKAYSVLKTKHQGQ